MNVTTIAMIALMVVAFYFLILRPQKKRQQAQQKTMNELTPGTRVLLGSGIFGTLTWVGAKQATMETAPGIEVTVLKQAIARVVTEGDEYTEPVVDEDDEVDEQIDDHEALEPVDEVTAPGESSEPVVEPVTETVLDEPEPRETPGRPERTTLPPTTSSWSSTNKD